MLLTIFLTETDIWDLVIMVVCTHITEIGILVIHIFQLEIGTDMVGCMVTTLFTMISTHMVGGEEQCHSITEIDTPNLDLITILSTITI